MTHEVHIPVPGLTQPIKPAGVVIIDGETGEALPASALFGVTLAELLASVLPVAPNVTRGGGALDANTQRVTLARPDPTNADRVRGVLRWGQPLIAHH